MEFRRTNNIKEMFKLEFNRRKQHQRFKLNLKEPKPKKSHNESWILSTSLREKKNVKYCPAISVPSPKKVCVPTDYTGCQTKTRNDRLEGPTWSGHIKDIDKKLFYK